VGSGVRGQKEEEGPSATTPEDRRRKREEGNKQGHGAAEKPGAKCEKAVKRKALTVKAGNRRYSIFRADCGISFIWKIRK